MDLFCLLFGLVFIIRTPSVTGTNDITTVYKINTIKSDMNEVKYLNTCTVSVRVQHKDEDFPLFSINDNSSMILDWRQIPPLYSEKRSNWSVVVTLRDGGTKNLPLIYSDYVNPYYWLDMNLMILKGHNFFRFLTSEVDPDISYTEKQISSWRFLSTNENKTVFNKYDMEEVFKENDIFTKTVLDVRPCYRETKFGIKLYWTSNKTQFIEIILDQPGTIKVCTIDNELKNCSKFPIIYGSLQFRHCTSATWFGIILQDGEVNIYNFLKNGKVEYIRTNHYRPKEFDSYTEVEHNYIGFSKSYFMYYELVEIKPKTLHSPWFKLYTNTSLFILYFTEPGYKLEVALEEKITQNITQLEYHESDGVNYTERIQIEKEITRNTTQLEYHELDRVNYTERIQRVLIKVSVGVPHNGRGNQRITINGDKHVFIGNIWEQTNLDINKEQGPVACDKSNIIDIYNTVERTATKTKKESYCKHGGRLEEDTCVCPPGFAGNQCQSPCGRNHFGEKCSFVCSNSSNECKGMILCTPYYGCTCAPGYYGDECNMQCKEGFYGADCKQTCKQCPYGCNKYTGACREKICSKLNLMSSYCSQNHSYLRDFPEIVETNFTSVTLQVNFVQSQIVGSLKRSKFFMVQYQETASCSSWNNGPYEEFNQVITNITVNGLKPGLLYEFRVVLIDYSQETQDTLRSKIIQAETNCTLSLRQQNLQISSISFRTIGLTWDKETALEEMECPIIDYLLEIDEMTETGHAKSKHLVQVKGNSYSIENLNPGKTYSITLKRVTIFGESEPIASKDVTTDDDMLTKLIVYKTTSNRIGLRWNMPNITLKMVHINIELLDLSYKIWNKTIDMSIILHSYQCKPWPGFTCYDVTELVMNTKYNITVKLSTVGSTQDVFSKSIVAETKETSPSSVRDVKLKLISDTSMSLSWRIPFQLNGILRKFIIEVEHVSSFVKEVCCQSTIIDYLVSAEVEIYSHVLQDIKPASSYQITIRPLAKGLGPKVSQTIETPLPHVPFQRQVVYSNHTLQLQQTETNNEEYNTLMREILVIVESNQPIHTNPLLETLDGFQYEMSEILGNNNWWLTHVCAAADETCTIDLTLQTESTPILPYYGKPLQSGNQYRIVLAQVNQYQSARSYTVELYSLSM
uniref:Tyrosine-protein kinase receptor Tie-1 n=1 Tax=Cacopsylla melanoneura TaxID=428564 RepID=A0A8D8VFT6_9HEMI